MNLKNFFVYNTFDSSETTKYTINIVDGNVEVIIRSCIFCDGCKDWGKENVGKIYCEHVDTAILKGYNPDIEFEIPSSLTSGDKRCIQRYIVKKENSRN